MRTLTMIFALLGAAVVASAQTKPMVNDDVVQMTRAGFDEQTVVKAIQASPPQFDTSVGALVGLKNAGVSKNVIEAMLDAQTKSDNAAALPSPKAGEAAAIAPAATRDPSPATSQKEGEWPAELKGMYREVGIYYKQNDKFVQLFGKPVVATQTGGFLKSSFTMGLSKIRSKGELPGKHAQLQLGERQPIFYFYMPENETPDAFSVIRLDEKGDRRRFQVGSAGGASGSHSRGLDIHKVSQILIERVAPRVYRVTPDRELDDGEYGFVGTLAALGVGGGEKIYDFGVHLKRR